MAARNWIDLNADVGESFGPYAFGNDRGLMDSITSASIAAGFHAGDPSVLRQTIRLAKAHGVAVGAHPGFPDLVGFGRRELKVTPEQAEDFVLYQIAAVAGVALAEGVRLQHVKPHGALFNMAATDAALAAGIVRATAAFDPTLLLFVSPGSTLFHAARAAGLATVEEAFADREYQPDGTLVPRNAPGAVIGDVHQVVSRAIRIATEHEVVASDGSILTLRAKTICVHGDTPGADRLASAIRVGLEDAGVSVRPIGASRAA